MKPGKLYKYRPFNIHSLRLITEAEAFYAPPTIFNDPLDCDPTIEIDINRNQLEKLLFYMLQRNLSKREAEKQIDNLRYLSTEHGQYDVDTEAHEALKWMLARDIKKQLVRELSARGVLSLSKTWKSILMWSHYADEHRGICIEYDTVDQDHESLSPVSYNSPRAVKTSDIWNWKIRKDKASEEKILQTYFYSKSPEWRYEREWRDISAAHGIKSTPFRITAIIFGLRCNAAVMTSIVKLLNAHQAVKLWQVFPKDDSFRLHRHKVDRDEIEAVGVKEPSYLWFKDLVHDDEKDEPFEAEVNERKTSTA